MKSLMLLLRCVLADASTWCCTSTHLDFKTIEMRVEHEGISFLTITLPTFCADFERSLDKGYVDPAAFLSFRKRGALPLFLGGLLDLVFDRSSGLLLDKLSVDAIYFIRQITLMWKKILLPCSKERERRAYDSYIECEKEVGNWEANCPKRSLDRFGRIADLVWSSDASHLDLAIYDGSIKPRHGPGATADRLFGNEKYRMPSWTWRLEDYFPSTEFCIPNSGFHTELSATNFFEPGAELPVRVISVPKTLKTPRIIAIEPSHVQYAQQALMEVIVDRIEKSDFLQGSIGFTDQVPNQDMARIGSKDGSLATIDLSEASDRVSNLLVKTMFRNYPTLAGAIQASRSERADVPGHGIVSLFKFASMGSATTFPVEAMAFLTIICVAYESQLNRSLTKKDVYSLLGKVRVYGDDIIVPTDLVRFVVSELETYGLRVNTKKSFWTGRFRESCGKDYYADQDVTVTYCRRVLPERRSDVSEMISAVSLRNQLYKAGLWKSADFLDQYLRRLAPLPTVLETSPVIGRWSFLGYETEKDCQHLHRPLVKGMVVVPKLRKSPLDGHSALLKFFLKRESNSRFSWLFPSNSDAKHLERYGRPESVDIKIRWAPAA
jgi:hypothetical protein